jgi:aminoglycoside phosphotransferase
MMLMIPKALRRILLGAGLLVMAQSMAIGAQASEKAKPMAPNYEIVDLLKSGLANIREKDPKWCPFEHSVITKGALWRKVLDAKSLA